MDANEADTQSPTKVSPAPTAHAEYVGLSEVEAAPKLAQYGETTIACPWKPTGAASSKFVQPTRRES